MSGAEAIRAADSGDLLDDVLALPDHLRDALWRVESARLAPMESSGVAVCGMGGSGVGGALARAAAGDRLRLPLTTVRDYRLEPWTPANRVVLCASYSGNTEETLACFEAAAAIGAPLVVTTTGGALGAAAREAQVPVIPMPAALQPRAAIGYMLVSAIEVAALAGAVDSLRHEIDEAAARLAEEREALIERAADIAAAMDGAHPVVYGADVTAPVAYRWKAQVNENAKAPAFSHVLPEADHNEIEGWSAKAGADRFAGIFLFDSDQHPRVRRRMELTAELIEPEAHSVHRIEMEGESRTARMLAGVMLGDLVSLHVAARSGVDPTPVAAIARLKQALGDP